MFKTGIQDRVTGWVKYGQRWYNPTRGRWTQQDTLDTPLNPANANRYAFAANDPINNSDPTGRDTQNQWVCFGSWFFAAAGYGSLLLAAFTGGLGALAFTAFVTVGSTALAYDACDESRWA